MDTSREIIWGDETTYHYAAENLIKYRTLTYDINGDIYNGNNEATPTPKLQPGYPIYIALIYILFGHSTSAVLISHVLLSIFSFWLIYRILTLLKIRKPFIMISLILAAVYPGFLYSIDRMLTEQLFTTLFLAFVYCFLKSRQTNNVIWLGISAALLTCASHVRALAFPFAVVVIFFLIIYDQNNKKNAVRNVTVFISVILLFMLPWWVRNWITFDKFMLFSDAGYSPKVWGAVPYFIDMASTNNQPLNVVLENNVTPNPGLYYKWRIFGFFQYMWGDLWDENLVHPYKYLRPFIALQQLIIVPCIMAIPFLIKNCRKEVLFISCIPIAFTLMNMPFHGLPRYVYPSVPFVLVLVGVLLELLVDTIRKKRTYELDSFLSKWQGATDRWVLRGYTVFAAIFSIILFYSIYIFAYEINGEMSEYRLGRYMGITQTSLQANDIVFSKKYNQSEMMIENSSIINGKYKNDVDAPAIIKVSDNLLNDSIKKQIVTEVSINIQGGYLYDYMTVYWTGRNTQEISENNVYKFPISKLEKSQKIFIDDDVNFLMVVPAVFRGGEFKVDSIEINKYKVQVQ
ncbi:glycosyltransferase family 39 protein [Paenibacillus polymyxa]|uniref:ArnT family glycosyltransferase n=1 Tax=Paenibacillus polymyxa TaxID=1406 RepID=UPI002AB32F23|nr:glycosyltransferase family 39 protein [Paenibacillus polymyxa]MDY8095879.1 glycosyltransferase family 39 protein [Paenibacillus polymyxa]